ncbi:terminase large subunit domain-containing protein [Natronorarus salvus]|uniref:terminase large subunit domain-containing protein n=1 Tax=Natronorarus salvus TaxID=3117733 RepID=UPI002F2677CC
MTASSQATTVELNHQWTTYQADTLRAIHSGEYDLVVLRTGYGGGKSVLGSRWIHRTALQRGGEYLVLAPDFAKGGPATYRVFFDELPGENTVPNDAAGDPENSPIVAGYNANEKRLTYTNGAVARLGSADKWNRYAGSEFNGIWGDEPAHYDTTNLYDLHEMLVSRQRTEAGPNVTLWTSTGAGFNQYYDITERKVDEDGEPLPWADRMEVIVGSSLDNPFLSEKEKMLAQFEGTPREAQALHGGFAAAQGLVYPSFSRERNVVAESEAWDLVSGDWRIYGYDHGWADPRVVLEIAKTSYDQYIVVDSFYRSETKYQKAVDWLRDNEKPVGTIHSETEPEHQEAFRSAGYPCEGAIKDLDEGIALVRQFVDVDHEERPGLLVSDRCVELVQEFMSYKEEHVGKSVAEDHALDALRYALMGDNFSQTKPTTVRYHGSRPEDM